MDLWSGLAHDHPRLVRELAKAGTTPTYLLRDYLDAIEQERGARPVGSDQRLLEAALVYFGDQGHPQPKERTWWADLDCRTPYWGQLPPLDTDETAQTLVSNDRPGMRRQYGPLPTFHDPGVIGAALAAIPPVEDAMTASGLNSKDVLRAEKLKQWGLLRWNGSTLWAHPEQVRQRGGEVALRVLSGDGSEWLDPLDLRAAPNPQ